MDFGADAPQPVYEIPAAERETRVVSDSDFCVLDDEHFFVRGIIEIPVHGQDQTFNWGVWVSLSENNFKRTIELLDAEGRENEPPYFGWLCNSLPYPEPTLFLKTKVNTNAVGLRPKIELEPTMHPLAVEQREGISLERVQEIAERILHA